MLVRSMSSATENVWKSGTRMRKTPEEAGLRHPDGSLSDLRDLGVESRSSARDPSEYLGMTLLDRPEDTGNAA
jgi:hypothetical protein